MAATDPPRKKPHTRHLAPFLMALVAAVVFAAGVLNPAHAEDYVAAQGYVHSFSNNISIYSGVFALNRDLSLDTSVYGKYTVDMINPFDEGGGGDDDGGGGGGPVVSGASSSVSDTRHELTFGVSRNIGWGLGAEAYIDYSRESDYTSLTPSITLKQDLFEKNTTITLGYSQSNDDISGRFLTAPDKRTTKNYFIGITQLLSPTTFVQAGYTKTHSTGLESEGIRLVPVDGATAASCTAVSATCFNEAFPRVKDRKAYMAGLSHYFESEGVLGRSAIKFFLRYYEDDWDVSSYTAETEWYKYLRDDVILRLNYRYYDQTAAFFVKSAYLGTDTYFSSSPQLEAHSAHLVGVKGIFKFRNRGDDAGTIEGKYEFYTESPGVNAHVLMAGVRVPF